MTNLTIVANIHARPDKIDQVKKALQGLIGTTRAEAGCILYDLHQDNEDPAHFMFYEICESRALWQAHMSAPHLAVFAAATEGAIAELTINEMTKTD